MFIGLTYDLRGAYLAVGYGEEETAEFDSEETIEAIEGALRRLGHRTDRVGHARQLVSRLAAGDRWDLVFNICEGLRGVGREAQVPALLDLFEVPYTFSDPLVMALTLHKGMTKSVVRDAGVPTARFAVIDALSQLNQVRLDYPLFAKPIAEGTGKGIDGASIIHDSDALAATCGRLLDRFQQAVLVEEFLPGREFTVGILGTGDEARVLGTLEIALRQNAEPNVYSYLNKEECEDRVDYRLVSGGADETVREAEQIAMRAWRVLGCRDAGRIDLRCDLAGRPQFVEVNPLAGVHPHHSDLPILCTAVSTSYDELIDGIVQSASRRIAVAPGVSRWRTVSPTGC
ncbi:MAG: D-alanine--D-alanine ligase [Acidobacteria bacterium]|nr:D-alanine--D-alanine ligase [Acidobacteriota bacterium]